MKYLKFSIFCPQKKFFKREATQTDVRTIYRQLSFRISLSSIPYGNSWKGFWHQILTGFMAAFWHHFLTLWVSFGISVANFVSVWGHLKPNVATSMSTGISWLQIQKIWHKNVQERHARKRIHNCCLVWSENSVIRDNCSASQGSYPDDRIFNPHLRCKHYRLLYY